MLSLGLLGKNIAHSKSQKMYEELTGEPVDYKLFDYNKESEIPSLDWFFKNIKGLSITSPYKRHFLDAVNVEDNFDSINCIKHEKGQYWATNTDYKAIEKVFPKILDLKDYNSIFILGDGSMASLSKRFLDSHKIKYSQLSRKKNGPLEETEFKGNSLIINTCSREFIYRGQISKTSVFYDFNYNFRVHKNYLEPIIFKYFDGLELLKLQALYALKFWGASL
ncbi:MAG: hypothetical protein OEY33_03805 [Bdellovibrionales bacterium]|jgi:shikimate dehydrogenase|nr:hypothetical protein [Bdellovibrionales bacterium]